MLRLKHAYIMTFKNAAENHVVQTGCVRALKEVAPDVQGVQRCQNGVNISRLGRVGTVARRAIGLAKAARLEDGYFCPTPIRVKLV